MLTSNPAARVELLVYWSQQLEYMGIQEPTAVRVGCIYHVGLQDAVAVWDNAICSISVIRNPNPFGSVYQKDCT